MAYKLIVTEHANELLDNLVYYLLYRLKSEQAAGHLLDGVEKVYERLEDNPLQFPLSRDIYSKRQNKFLFPALQKPYM